MEQDKVLILRTCREDLTSYGGFRWPEYGPVEAPDWEPDPIAGCGLHGLLWGAGDGNLLDWSPLSRWLVIEVEATSVVNLGGKVKFPRGVVVHCGDQCSATQYLVEHGADPCQVVGYASTVGDYGVATASYHGVSTAGNGGIATTGKFGISKAGHGGTAITAYKGFATAGNYGRATAGDRGIATTGVGGISEAGYKGIATAGNRGIATVGCEGVATAGHEGIVLVRYWDDLAKRMRFAVGYVGEDGIEANRAYCVKNGKLVLAEDEEEIDE